MLEVRRMQVLRAEVTSVTAAAVNLGYARSAISQELSTLEHEAGLPLLEKAGRGVRPTPAGTPVAERAGAIAELLSLRHPEPVRRLYIAVREEVADQPATQAFLAALSESAEG
jgi:DNA-binding transcriptional LysR family regulator